MNRITERCNAEESQGEREWEEERGEGGGSDINRAERRSNAPSPFSLSLSWAQAVAPISHSASFLCKNKNISRGKEGVRSSDPNCNVMAP